MYRSSTGLRLLLLVVLLVQRIAHGWAPIISRRSSQPAHRRHHYYPSCQSSSCTTTTSLIALAAKPPNKQQQQRQSSTAVVADDNEDEDMPAGIEGAQFFGGNKQKEEFYDPEAEAKAGEGMIEKEDVYDRFDDRHGAFDDDVAADVARDVQSRIATVLYGDEEETTTAKYEYAPNLKWETPFPKSSDKRKDNSGGDSDNNPLQALGKALEFYRRVDVAIVGGRSLDKISGSEKKVVELRWEISVVWPTVWEPRVLLTGQSQLTLNVEKNQIITEQMDELDVGNGNLVSCITGQAATPRFWDVYHIGMTPSAEISPKLPLFNDKIKKGLLSNYQLYELPPRLYLEPTMLDLGTRQDSNAAMIPNHAFTCVVKTMGPQKQEYVPTGPVQVQLIQQSSSGGIQLQWLIPLAVETIALNARLPVPVPDDDDDEETTVTDPSPENEAQATCRYVYRPRRRVATLKYGGAPQDVEIADIRQKLYEQVTKDGFVPKLDEGGGRPIFFFWQNNVKACYTEEGLGMAVYEWRPKFVQSNEVGIELEL